MPNIDDNIKKYLVENRLLDTQKTKLQAYKNALKLTPNEPNIYNNLGIFFIQLGQFQIAIKCFKQAIDINPNIETAYTNLGNAFQELGKYQDAVSCYQKALHLQPENAEVHYNLGKALQELKKYQEAVSCYRRAIEINPNHADAYNNLGVSFYNSGDKQKAKNYYEKAIKIDSNNVASHNNLGILYKNKKKFKKAKNYFERAIKIDSNNVASHNNLGLVLNSLGYTLKAINCLKKAIQLDPSYGSAYNSLGLVFNDSGDKQKAKNYYEKAIKLNPNSITTNWNLHQFASNIEDALIILKKIINIDNNHIKSKAVISAIEGYKGNFKDFESLLSSREAQHPYIRSIKWVFSLPQLPKLFFNRWFLFDAIVEQTDQSKPFYEFGVWNGVSFQYLINKYKKGFGFDTFTGLPHSWHELSAGTYSSFGSVPKIKGGKFIVGKFEDTLPDFFSKKRPVASLINFDADLYSSTLCALNNAKDVIDEKTILIFDELLINKEWEEDEFKALNEFCNNYNFSYDVLAVSFFSKQVAVKIKK